MQKAKAAYMRRKQMQGLLGEDCTEEDIQRLGFKGIKIASYVPLTEFVLNLYGENFDLGLAL